MDPYTLTNIQKDEYRDLQSVYHRMINALRKWEDTDLAYPNKVLKMLVTLRELNETMTFLCGECEYELLNQNHKEQEEKRLTLLRKERDIIKKWCPYAFEE